MSRVVGLSDSSGCVFGSGQLRDQQELEGGRGDRRWPGRGRGSRFSWTVLVLLRKDKQS